MYARRLVYGMMMTGAVLLAGCTQEDVTTEVTPSTGVAIAFDCNVAEDGGWTTTRAGEAGVSVTRAGEAGVSVTRDEEAGLSVTRAGKTGEFSGTNDLLHLTGFGLFAGHYDPTAAEGEEGKIDLMYNQEVKYNFLADDRDNGYWSYYPLKYWPNDLGETNQFFFSAYAPYVETGSGVTGITAISDKTVNDPYIDYTIATNLEDFVDLLWDAEVVKGQKRPMRLTMHHALARLAITVKVADAVDLTGKKVLIEEVKLKGHMATNGRLMVNTPGETPRWTNVVVTEAPAEPRTITIDDKGSGWGIVDNDVRYISDLPVQWQPKGLTVESRTANVLSSDGHQAYIYLIPQDDLELEASVKYWVIDGDGPATKSMKTEKVTIPHIVGNTPYNLNIIIKQL